MLIPHSDFPVRPFVQKGESLAGYICRFHNANGHRVPLALHNALQSLYRGTPGIAARAFDIVQSIVGDSVALDRSQWPDIKRIERRSRAWRILTCSSARFCPVCLREHGFHFALWELPLVRACPLHKTALLTKCSRCQKPLSWPMIYPSWCCRCGQSITTMSSGLATKGAVAIAQCLVGANDVKQPDSFRKCLGEPVNEGYGLNDAYGGLEWIGDLRNVFMKSGPNPRKTSECQRLLISRSWPRAWDVKLLADSPEQTVVRLLRVLKKYFRKHERMLCVIKKSENLNSTIRSTYVAWDRSVFERKIHLAVEHILSEYNPKLPISSVVLYNPRFSNERRTKNLTRFMRWWNALSRRMEDLDPEIQSYQRKIASSNFKDSPQAMEIVDVLNILIDAALQQIDVEEFRALIYWWRIPRELRELTEPNEVLSQIGSHLMTIPDYEVYFVCSLVHLACKSQC